MNKLSLIVCTVLSIALFTGCKKEMAVHDGVVSITDPTKSMEVAFEDVATNIRIVPLISDEPIDQLSSRIKCYGSTAVIRSSSLYSLYVFEDGKLVGTLNKAGRGHGEYSLIKDFVYSPTRKVIYVISLGGSTVMAYSVPDMSFIGSFDTGSFSVFAEHDDSTLIAKFNYEGNNGIYYVDAQNGKVKGKVKDIIGLDALMNEDMLYYSPQHRILSEYGAVNTISELSAEIGAEPKVLLSYDFGKYGIPSDYDEISDRDIQGLLDFMHYIADHRETMVTDMIYTYANSEYTSLWYTLNLKKYYLRVTGDDMTVYSGFRASGISDPFLPNGMTDDGFVRIIQGTTESVFNSQERSEFSSELETAMKNQNLNNPVLVYYSIK